MTPPEPTRIREVLDGPAPELDDLRGGRLLPGLGRDEGLGPLAPLVVRDRDHRALEHGRMAGDALLDLDRRDVLAARDDDVLLPVAQLDVAVGMPHRDVAGVKPPAAERLGRCLGLTEIAHRRVVTAHDDLAERLGIARHIAHAAVDHANEVEDRVALTLARGQSRLLVERQRVPFLLPGTHRVRPVRLGEPIDVHRPEAELLEPPEQGRRGRPPRDGEPRARKSSYGSPGTPLSSMRTTRRPESGSGFTRGSSSASTKRNFATECSRM